MKKFKKALSMMMVYFMAVALLPSSNFSMMASAEQMVPKYISNNYLYFSSVYQRENKTVAAYQQNYENGVKYTVSLFNDGKEKVIQRDVDIYPIFSGIKNKVNYCERYQYNNYSAKYKEYNLDTDELSDYNGNIEIENQIKDKVSKKFDVKEYSEFNPYYEIICDKNGNEYVKYSCSFLKENNENSYVSFDGIYGNGVDLVVEINEATGGVIGKVFFNNDGALTILRHSYSQDTMRYFYEVDKVKNDKLEKKGTFTFENSKNYNYKSVALCDNRTFFTCNDSEGNNYLEEYDISGTEYNKINSYHVASGQKYKKCTQDSKGNLWFLKDEDNHRYVCEITNGNAIKKYEVDNFMEELYVYDDNNIVVTSPKGSTIINVKDESKGENTKPGEGSSNNSKEENNGTSNRDSSKVNNNVLEAGPKTGDQGTSNAILVLAIITVASFIGISILKRKALNSKNK